MTRLPIAPSGIWDGIQGEGELLGVPMSFVRLAGCSVGCAGCDTDYTVAERLCAAEIIERLQRLPCRQYVWLTGGEPLDHDIGPLCRALKLDGYRVALATSGVHECGAGWNSWDVEFLSVSPHSAGDDWKQRSGQQINLVPGLNGLRLADFDVEHIRQRFAYRYVTPLAGDSESLAECLAFARQHVGWRLGCQGHKQWGLP